MPASRSMKILRLLTTPCAQSPTILAASRLVHERSPATQSPAARSLISCGSAIDDASASAR
eukprot:scaffold83634_cov66-Phaeocystis_antarctica.AAC.5